MASIALRTRVYMRRRFHLCILGQVSSAMAGRAQAGKPAVIHGGRAPVYKAADMAGIALGDAGNMIDRARQRIGEEI